jgi:hypothetical protein
MMPIRADLTGERREITVSGMRSNSDGPKDSGG